jgi:hypothetical protein
VSLASIVKTDAESSSETLVNNSHPVGFNILKITGPVVYRIEAGFQINEEKLFPYDSSSLMPNYYRWNGNV